jgi:glutathione S-transferase
MGGRVKLEFIYWDIPFWRAETSRIALFIGGVEFEDHRPSWEEFLELKAAGELPFGQLPILKVDGEIIAQTAGIARFCGKLAGLYPAEDHLAGAKIDQVLDAATEITGVVGPSMRENDPEKKAALRARLAAKTLPRWLGFLEVLLEANRDSDFFVGESLTIADLAIWRMMGWLTGGILEGLPRDLMEPFPCLSHHFAVVDGEPMVREWMDAHYP